MLYIAFASFGRAPLEAFIGSYQRHSPGIDHHLYILCKGFSNDVEIEEFLEPATTVACSALRVPDGGFDLGTYHHVARRLDADVFCFLNTRSVVLGGGWLRMLHSHCRNERVGAAGSTASCESLYTDYLSSKAERRGDLNSFRAMRSRVSFTLWRRRYLFAPFPNPHLRTNAFMVRSDVLRRLSFGNVRSRLDAACLESGRRSITCQLARMGLDALVVGRDGCAYAASEWWRSGTFWQGEQGNLLVADNQTERYAMADAAGQTRLNRIAWGSDPTPAHLQPRGNVPTSPPA